LAARAKSAVESILDAFLEGRSVSVAGTQQTIRVGCLTVGGVRDSRGVSSIRDTRGRFRRPFTQQTPRQRSNDRDADDGDC
jgi:hypothetical protein